MTQQITKKKMKIPPELQEALEALELDFDKLQTKVDKVFDVGREKGYSDMQIGNLIREKMRGKYHKQTISRVFENYPDAKQKQNKKVNKKPTFEQPDKCPKCGKPYKDPEDEIWQFRADQFKIEEIDKRPRKYNEDALEHWYAEARKWKAKYEALIAKNEKKQSTMGSEEDKKNLLKKALKFREELNK